MKKLRTKEKKMLSITLTLALCMLWQTKARAITNIAPPPTDPSGNTVLVKSDNTYDINSGAQTGIVNPSDNVYGGKSSTAGTNTNTNTVEINGVAKIGNIWGGYSDDGAAKENIVDIKGNTAGTLGVTLGVVFGGNGSKGASSNQVNISGIKKLTLTENYGLKGIFGGGSPDGAVTGNKVSIEGNTAGETEISGNIYGGRTSSNDTEATNKLASGNTVEINGVKGVTRGIFGGMSDNGVAIGNEVKIIGNVTGNTVIESTVCGGRGKIGANNNKVEISGVLQVVLEKRKQTTILLI